VVVLCVLFQLTHNQTAANTLYTSPGRVDCGWVGLFAIEFQRVDPPGGGGYLSATRHTCWSLSCCAPPFWIVESADSSWGGSGECSSALLQQTHAWLTLHAASGQEVHIMYR